MFEGEVVASAVQNSLIHSPEEVWPAVLIQLVNIKNGACCSGSVSSYGQSLSLARPLVWIQYFVIRKSPVMVIPIYDVMIS